MEEQFTPNDTNYHISYTLTPEAANHIYKQMLWVHRHLSPEVQNVFHLLVTAVPLFAIIKITAFLFREASLLPCIFFVLAGISFMGLLLLKLREINLLKYLKSVGGLQTPPYLYGSREMWFYDDCICLDTGTGPMYLPWEIHTYIYETEDSFFLIQLTGDRKESYLFLPRMSLGGLDRQEAFVSLCLKHGLKAQKINTYDSEQPVKAAGRPKMIVLFFMSVLLLTMAVPMLYFDMIYNFIR